MPELAVVTHAVTNINGTRAYIIYTVGGFRRQTATVRREDGNVTWSTQKDLFPVTEESDVEMGVTVFEPSSFGDRHCGSTRINWMEWAATSRTSVALLGINTTAGKTMLEITLSVDAPRGPRGVGPAPDSTTGGGGGGGGGR
eukprot:NODE_2409_length_547_cov_233.315261_g1629_i1.p1 GENE.NODE_2409_length_547_cov_233.315261_g1629_i1~~NODE_2409_length_547_cov_233.315261_g1629_i1.p1  ORF type:complete len:142 (+),score=43.00 NODE_2409_length_547_cov_233.315261_g1629_i1:111-536(+)